MLNSSTVVTFLATSRPDEARKFYAGKLGLELVSDEPFAIVFNANGVMMRIQKVQDHTPLPHTALGWDVEDISACVEELTDKGIVFERFEQLTQNKLGVWLAPGGARIAWFKDPDGNTLSLTEFS